MPLPLIAAAAAAASGGIFKWATDKGDGKANGKGASTSKKPNQPFTLTREESEANRVLLLQDPGALLDRKMTVRGKNNGASMSNKFFSATAVDYNSDEDEYQLEYVNGQVLWVDLKFRQFKLESESDADDEDGDGTDGVMSGTTPDEEDEAEGGALSASRGVDTATLLAAEQRVQAHTEAHVSFYAVGAPASVRLGQSNSGQRKGASGSGLMLRLGGRVSASSGLSKPLPGRAADASGAGVRPGGVALAQSQEEMTTMRLERELLEAIERSDASPTDTGCALVLNRRAITAEGGGLLGNALAVNKNITALDLQYNCLGADGASLLCAGLRVHPALTDLQLAGNEVGPVGLAALSVTLPHCASLTSLGLASNVLGNDSGVLLASVLTRCSERLTHLDVSGSNELGAKAGRLMADALAKHNRSLTSLCVSDNPIGTTGFTALAKALYNVPVALPGSSVSSNSAQPRAANLTLTSLHASNCAVGHRGGAAIATALAGGGGGGAAAALPNLTLTHLDLSQNLLGESGGAALLRVLKLPEEKRALERLELQGDAACEECLRNNLPDLSRVAADVICDSLNASILSTLSDA